MKHLIIILITLSFVGISAAAQTSLPSSAVEDNSSFRPENMVVLQATVRDAQTRKRLANVNVYLPGSDIGTVTNGDGFFSLKIASEHLSEKLVFSCLGYANTKVACQILCKEAEATVFLNPTSRVLREVTILGGDARHLVDAALQRIEVNYTLHAHLLNMFYRETIMKGSRFVAISEGVVDVYKTGYQEQSVWKDRARLIRGRRLLNQKAQDTLAVKIKGGPLQAIYMDIIKNGDAIFDSESINYYDFKHEHADMLNDRLHYVVSFKPHVVLDYPLYSGLLYIDTETLCLTRAELSLDVSDKEKVNRIVLKKKPLGLRFRCRESSVVVTYRRHGDRTCLDYMRNVIRFHCDWKRRLFSSAYSAVAEMVVVDVDHTPSSTIPSSQAYNDNQLFYDDAKEHWDEHYWRDYNIIEPTESLEKAVLRLKKK